MTEKKSFVVLPSPSKLCGLLPIFKNKMHVFSFLKSDDLTTVKVLSTSTIQRTPVERFLFCFNRLGMDLIQNIGVLNSNIWVNFLFTLKHMRATSDNTTATKGNGSKELLNPWTLLIALLMKAISRRQKKHLATCMSKRVVIRWNPNHWSSLQTCPVFIWQRVIGTIIPLFVKWRLRIIFSPFKSVIL